MRLPTDNTTTPPLVALARGEPSGTPTSPQPLESLAGAGTPVRTSGATVATGWGTPPVPGRWLQIVGPGPAEDLGLLVVPRGQALIVINVRANGPAPLWFTLDIDEQSDD